MIALPLLLVVAQGYDGRFAGHESLSEISRYVRSVAENTAEDLPKWIAKREPSVEVRLVDLAEPLQRYVWPGDVDAHVSVELDGRDSKLSIDLPVDTFIASPTVAPSALARQIFGAASTARATREEADARKLPAWGLSNPLIEAMAAHWAGTLDREIAFVLRRHLGSDEAIAALVQPITAVELGSAPELSDPDELTWHVLVKRLAPKENREEARDALFRLGEGADARGGPQEGESQGAREAERGPGRVLEEYVEEEFPASSRERFRGALTAFEEDDPARLLAALNGLIPSGIMGAHFNYFLLYATVGLDEDMEGDSWRAAFDLVWYDDCDLGLELGRRTAREAPREGEDRSRAGGLRDPARELRVDRRGARGGRSGAPVTPRAQSTRIGISGSSFRKRPVMV